MKKGILFAFFGAVLMTSVALLPFIILLSLNDITDAQFIGLAVFTGFSVMLSYSIGIKLEKMDQKIRTLKNEGTGTGVAA